MQPKKQLKVQYIGIFEEIDSFHWPKMHFLKEGQKIRAWVGPPPLIRAMPERKRFFSIEAFPNINFWNKRQGNYLYSCTYFCPVVGHNH